MNNSPKLNKKILGRYINILAINMRRTSQGFTDRLWLTDEEISTDRVAEVFRRVHQDRDVEESDMAIRHHFNEMLQWYYEIPRGTTVTIDAIKNMPRFKQDTLHGLKPPSYGELVWWDMGDLTPVIAHGLDPRYKLMFMYRSHKHTLKVATPPRLAEMAALAVKKLRTTS